MPPDEPAPAAGRSSRIALYAVLFLLGLGLAAFGAFRLVAEDAEIDRLSDELAAVEADRAEVQASAGAAGDRVEAIVAAGEELDEALIAMVDAFEAFAEQQRTVNRAWNDIDAAVGRGEFGRPADLAQVQAAVVARVMPEVQEAKESGDALLRSFAEAQAALGSLRDVLQEGG